MSIREDGTMTPEEQIRALVEQRRSAPRQEEQDDEVARAVYRTIAIIFGGYVIGTVIGFVLRGLL